MRRDNPNEMPTPADWALLNEWQDLLETSVVDHVFLPAAMGLGAASLPRKMVALLFAWCMERPDLSSLVGFLNSIVAVTTDLGVEAGIPFFRFDSFGSAGVVERDADHDRGRQ